MDKHNGDPNWPPPLEDLDFDSQHDLADDRLRRIFEGPMPREFGLVECRQGQSHAVVQGVLNAVINNPKGS